MLPCAEQNSFSCAVAMCANMHKIKVYSVPFLEAAVLMRNATVSICDRITDRTYLTIPYRTF